MNKDEMLNDKATMEMFRKKLATIKIYLSSNPNSQWLTPKVFEYSYVFQALPMPTMATDGKQIMIDPEFFHRIPLKQAAFGVIHETLHNVFRHFDYIKRKDIDHKAANIAMDCVINSIIIMSDIGEPIPEGYKCDRNGTVEIPITNKQGQPDKVIIQECHTKTWKFVYDELIRNCQTVEVKVFDEHKPSNNDTSESESDAEVENTIRRLVDEHRAKGKNLPHAIAEHFGKLIKPKVNLKSFLKTNIVGAVSTYDTYSKYNRRSELLDMQLPGYMKEGFDMIAAIDTSGSVSDEEVRHAMGMLYHTAKSCGKGTVRLHLMLHNSEVYFNKEIKNEEDLKKIKIKSGGTCHLEVFEKAAELKGFYNKLLICITDGETNYPTNPKVRNVLWVIVDNDRIKPPFGKTIHVSMDDIKKL